MRRRHTAAVALLCLSLASCSFDFVAPEPGSPVARLSLAFSTRPSLGDSVSMHATLDPGVELDGSQSPVPDPRLLIFGTPLTADTSRGDTGVILSWSQVIPGVLAQASPMVIEAPGVEGRGPPPALWVSLRREAEGSARGRTWTRGEELVLPLRHASADIGVDSYVWNLSVSGWHADGPPTSLVMSVVRTPVGDTVRVPAGWLPNEDFDSLTASVRYTRQFVSTSADGSYVVNASVDQLLSWVFVGSRP